MLRFRPQPARGKLIATSSGVALAALLALLVASPAASSQANKTGHILSLDYSFRSTDVTEGPGGKVTMYGAGTIEGKPFGKQKGRLSEAKVFTPNPNNGPYDFSGSVHATFSVSFAGRGGIRGFYDFSRDSDGAYSSAEPGVITGGTGDFKGATGKFVVPNNIPTPCGCERPTYTAHWKGSIRF